MQQLRSRAALNYRWPYQSQRRTDTPYPSVNTYGWEPSPIRTLRVPLQGLNGLGATTAQTIGAGSGIAAGAAGLFQSHTVGGKIASAGGMIISSAPLAGPYAPAVAIAGAVVALSGQIMTFLHIGDGCGESCVLTSDWANQAETLLRQNISAYFAAPAPRLTTSKEEALRGFDKIWGQLASACQKVGGGAGHNCIADREAGACHYHQTADSPWPGGPKVGECWNWASAYRDPIANDSQVITPEELDRLSADSSTGGAGGGVGSFLDSKNSLLLIGGALLLVGVMGGQN